MNRLQKEMKVLCICGIVIGFVFLGVGGYQGLKAHLASSWPTVEGQILSSVVGEYNGLIAGEGEFETRASIQYSYRIQGQEFRGNLNDPNQSLVRRYPKGSKVMVHYDPSDPRNATIFIKTNRSLALIWVGVVFCIASPFVTHFIARHSRTTTCVSNDAALENEIQNWKHERFSG